MILEKIFSVSPFTTLPGHLNQPVIPLPCRGKRFRHPNMSITLLLASEPSTKFKGSLKGRILLRNIFLRLQPWLSSPCRLAAQHHDKRTLGNFGAQRNALGLEPCCSQIYVYRDPRELCFSWLHSNSFEKKKRKYIHQDHLRILR